MQKSFERIILGLDPGTNIMGFGVIGIENKKVHLIEMGIFNLSKLEDQTLKLKGIFDQTSNVIEKFKPDELAIEAPFFGKNVQSMLKLGRAQGVAIGAALNHSMVVNEYSPRKIKQSVTGNGNASKEQVAAMIKQLLGIKENHKYLDASDAVAVALCHFYQGNSHSSGKKNFNSWEAFVKANPTRKK
jgi:crossover junction endodeoxyribonuclease RuvC